MDRVLLALSKAQIGWGTFWRLSSLVGDVALLMDRSAVRELPVREALKRRLLELSWEEPLEEEVAAKGMGYVTVNSPEYPKALRRLKEPPYVLFYMGDLDVISRRCVAVVGSRKASLKAKEVAYRLAKDVASQGFAVVSGMALGVDSAAHRGALASGTTVAVLGSALDVVYPATNRALFREIVAKGLALSPFYPGTPPKRHHFPMRNGIIAALSERVVVVEAGARSGALITARYAMDLGIPVEVVDIPAEGNRLLMEMGASPLVLEDKKGDDDPVVLLLEERGPLSTDEMVAILGMEAGRLQVRLIQLELEGKVRRLTGGYYEKA